MKTCGDSRTSSTLISTPVRARSRSATFCASGPLPADSSEPLLSPHAASTSEVASTARAVLAVTVRQADITHIPTVAETFPDFSMLGSIFLLGPAKMAGDVVQRVLLRYVVRGLADDEAELALPVDVRARLRDVDRAARRVDRGVDLRRP